MPLGLAKDLCPARKEPHELEFKCQVVDIDHQPPPVMQAKTVLQLLHEDPKLLPAPSHKYSLAYAELPAIHE